MPVRADQLVWGSMRMLEKRRPKGYWLDFLRSIHDKGIRKIHSSHEYESFSLLCEVLADLKKDGYRFQYVVKVAEPHFGRDSFDQKQFDCGLDQYLNCLQTERLDTVQWMWRGDINKHAEQVSNFLSAREIINDCFEREHVKKRTSRLMCFPYSPAFGLAALEEWWCAGLIVYLNHVELEYLELCERASRLGKSIIALRPFFGGKVLRHKGVQANGVLQWVLEQPGVAAAVATFSAADHVPELVA